MYRRDHRSRRLATRERKKEKTRTKFEEKLRSKILFERHDHDDLNITKDLSHDFEFERDCKHRPIEKQKSLKEKKKIQKETNIEIT